MSKSEKNVGIVICDRYHTCAGGKRLRALKNKEGVFSLYADQEVKLVGYTTCGDSARQTPKNLIAHYPLEYLVNNFVACFE